MSQERVSKTSKTEGKLEERRDFLTKSALLLAVLGLNGFGDAEVAEAQPNTIKLSKRQASTLQAVVREATARGDMSLALKEKGSSLPAAVKESLAVLTPEDLKMVSSLRSKLGRLEGQLAADNNGVVIM